MALNIYCATPQYTCADSIKVVKLLTDAKQIKSDSNMMIYFARQFLGIPYAAQTLDKNNEERLVINLRQLDCTTYVENVLALTLCIATNKTTFDDFCRYLQNIRYAGCKVSYVNRLHYFTEWINHNTRMSYVKEVQSSVSPFTNIQALTVNYMSTHSQAYPMLVKHPEWIKEISAMERKLTGNGYYYISKFSLNNSDWLRAVIHDGDIIAITTNKVGLDISHIGIAVWHKDGLHLLNASSIRHKVVEEPRTLRDYMITQSGQTGVRVIKIK